LQSQTNRGLTAKPSLSPYNGYAIRTILLPTRLFPWLTYALVILGWTVDLLPGTYHNQNLDISTVPTNLSRASLPNRLLWLACYCDSVWNMGCRQQHLHLQSGIVLLERNCSRALYESKISLVYKFRGKHRPGSAHSAATNAPNPDTQNI
jgi:hypothetical protein